MPFELTAPGGLWLGALLAPLVLLYVLKSRRRRLVVSSVHLWRTARRDLEARNPFRRLIPEVPLALEALCLALLALALANPRARQSGAAGETVAVVVDVSASMGTRQKDGATRLTHAVAEAKALVRGLLPGSAALVIAAGESPRVVSSVEADRQRLLAAVDDLEVRHEPGNTDAAVALAIERLSARGGSARVIVLTDAGGAAVPAAGRVPVDVHVVGEPVDNAGIVRSDIRRASDTEGDRRLDVFLVVENFAASPTERFVMLRRKGSPNPVASRRVTLPAGSKAAITLSYEAATSDVGTGLVAELSPPDALDADDQAFLVVPPGKSLPVYVEATTDPGWISRALASDPHIELESSAPGRAAPVGALRVAVGLCPEADHLGDVLIVHPPPGLCAGLDVGPDAAIASVTSWERHDPRLRFVDLEGLAFPKPRPLTGGARSSSLVRAGDIDLIAHSDSEGRHRTIVSFDVNASRWPLSASFVVFLRNVSELARDTRARLVGQTAQGGQPLRLPVPTSARNLVIEDPEGRVTPLAAHDGLALAPAPRHVGFHFAHWEGPSAGSKLVGVTLSSPEESNTQSARARSGAAPAPKHEARDAVTPFAWVLALFAAALALFDAAWIARGRPRAALRDVIRRPVLVGFGVLATVVAVAGLSQWAGWFGSEAPLRFARPSLALLGIPAVTLASLLVTRQAARWMRARRVLTEITVLTAVFASVLASAEPEAGLALERLAVVVAVDRSRSIELVPNVQSRVRAELTVAETSMRSDDGIAVVVFGADAKVEDPLRPPSRVPTTQRVEVGRDATDIEAGVRRALAEIPPDAAGRVALISDGVATRGDALDAAAAARVAGVPIDVVPLDQRHVENVRVADVRAPATAALDEPVEIRVVTEAPRATELEVRLYRNGELVRSGMTPVAAGEDVIWLRDRAPEAGLHRYEVEVTAPDGTTDGLTDDNRGASFVRVHGTERALVIGVPGSTPAMAEVLRRAGMDAVVLSPDALPADVVGFAAYDLVVLGDVPARDVSATQLDALAAYVEHAGGGLLLLGGRSSLGPGGYGRTPIERVSPVSFDLKQDRRRGTLAEVIAIDYSGSMSATAGAHTKLDLANEAAIRSASLLGSGDRVGVMHVDTEVRWTARVAEPNRESLEKQIRAVGPGGGGIYVDIALREAYRALDAERTNLRHVLLFSDGSDAEERTQAPTLVADAAQRGITTSVIALGQGEDVPGLEQLSRLGGGRFYVIEHAGRLPAVFAQETITAARSAIGEEPFVPSVEASARYLSDVDFDAVPPLGGYVITIAKPRADVALAGPEADPVLASWSAGLGKVATFTSDYGSTWGSEWVTWPEAAQMFAQLGRFLARRMGDRGVEVEAEARQGALAIRATTRASQKGLDAVVGGPEGTERRVGLEPTGAGVHTATVPLSRLGAYAVTVVEAGTNAPLATTAALLERTEELRPTGSDRAALGRLAALSGGRVRDTLAGIFEDRVGRRLAYEPLLPWLAVSTALALLLAVAARRMATPDFVVALPGRAAGLLQALSGRLFPAAPPGEADDATARALLRAKARSRGRGEPSAPDAASVKTRLTEEPAGPPHTSGQSEQVALEEPPQGPPAAAPEPHPSPETPELELSAVEILARRKRGR